MNSVVYDYEIGLFFFFIFSKITLFLKKYIEPIHCFKMPFSSIFFFLGGGRISLSE